LLLALLLATLVWYAIAQERRERISERQIDASVTLVNVPAQMIVTSDVPRSLTVRVRGPLRLLRTLDPAETGVVIDLRGAGEGESDFPVESQSVAVPQGVQVIAVVPAEVPLRLERLVRRRVPVQARVVGEPADGLAIGDVSIEPPSVIVSGPRQQVESLQAVVTDPIDVSGATALVESVATVRAPGPLARVVEPLAVRVLVAVTPQPPPAGSKR
jgi:YbbR domain-containing protein